MNLDGVGRRTLGAVRSIDVMVVSSESPLSRARRVVDRRYAGAIASSKGAGREVRRARNYFRSHANCLAASTEVRSYDPRRPAPVVSRSSLPTGPLPMLNVLAPRHFTPGSQASARPSHRLPSACGASPTCSPATSARTPPEDRITHGIGCRSSTRPQRELQQLSRRIVPFSKGGGA